MNKTLHTARYLSPPDKSKPFCCLCGRNDELNALHPAEASMPYVNERIYCEVHRACFDAAINESNAT